MTKRMKELKGLIEYHEKNILTIEELAQKEEVPEYRADMYARITRTRSLLADWKDEYNQLLAGYR